MDREATERPHVGLVNWLASPRGCRESAAGALSAGGQRGFPRGGDGPRVFPRDRENRDGV